MYLLTYFLICFLPFQFSPPRGWIFPAFLHFFKYLLSLSRPHIFPQLSPTFFAPFRAEALKEGQYVFLLLLLTLEFVLTTLLSYKNSSLQESSDGLLSLPHCS